MSVYYQICTAKSNKVAKKFSDTVFDTYEEARSFLRKYFRKTNLRTNLSDWGGVYHSNPSVTAYNYVIRRFK